MKPSRRAEPRLIKVKVKADSSQDQIRATGPDSFAVQVRAPARDGRANAAVLQLLSAELEVPAGRLWIVKGAHSPAKIIALRPPL